MLRPRKPGSFSLMGRIRIEGTSVFILVNSAFFEFRLVNSLALVATWRSIVRHDHPRLDRQYIARAAPRGCAARVRADLRQARMRKPHRQHERSNGLRGDRTGRGGWTT